MGAAHTHCFCSVHGISQLDASFKAQVMGIENLEMFPDVLCGIESPPVEDSCFRVILIGVKREE